MKKVVSFVVLIIIFSFTTSVYAQDGLYIGIGGTYAYEDF